MDYTELTQTDQYRMLQARLKRYEQQHYDATINLAVLPGTADETPQRLAALTRQVADLETSAATVKGMLDKLPVPTAPTRPGPPLPG